MENKQTYKQKHHTNFYYNFAAGVLKNVSSGVIFLGWRLLQSSRRLLDPLSELIWLLVAESDANSNFRERFAKGGFTD